VRIDLLGAFSSQLHIFVAFAAIEYENSCGGSFGPVVGVGRLSILFVCGSVCLPVCECGMPQQLAACVRPQNEVYFFGADQVSHVGSRASHRAIYIVITHVPVTLHNGHEEHGHQRVKRRLLSKQIMGNDSSKYKYLVL